MTGTAEEIRLQEDRQRIQNWKRWGPYLAERQWGTVREDYSADGDCWNYFTHEHAVFRAYRWGEDGLLGICDRECRLCFAVALWNEKDPILKERLFGLTGPEGNHGEDVKEYYFYLDATPTYSYMKALYKYPQREFPYRWLREENRRRGKSEPEFELADTGIFDDSRYFDVLAEYAKAAPNDVLIRLTVTNRGPETAPLHILPTLWFRNTWSWGCRHEGCEVKPRMALHAPLEVRTAHATLGEFYWYVGTLDGVSPHILFTENETNFGKLSGSTHTPGPFKDAFHEYVIHGNHGAVASQPRGTKCAAYYQVKIPAGGSVEIRLRLTNGAADRRELLGESFQRVFDERKREADEFYQVRLPARAAGEHRNIARQAYAGLLWTKQFYHYSVKDWLEGDPDQPRPPAERWRGRNREWMHLFNRDVISMPDKFEYPWYAAWDLAFHMLPMARIDPDFAKQQLVLLLREWYMHPNGQIPAYEFNFSDVNPPVHAWACWRVYKITGARGERDIVFLKRVFHKLLLNFTWWVNRKDAEGNNLFSGGFLGLDNIGVFDRSRPLPGGAQLEQADGTAWMAFYCATMLSMALEIASFDPAYEDVASKFFEHFVAIADAMNHFGGTGMWHEDDGFYYDQLHVDGKVIPMQVRSMVGLIPLMAVEVIDDEKIENLPGFYKRMMWFLEHRPELARQIAYMERSDSGGTPGKRLLAIPNRQRLERVLRRVFDEKEFLSPYGVRSLSRDHGEHPFEFSLGGEHHQVRYVPGESDSWMFGGNSNWRGPVWFPLNYLLIEALERYHYFYGDSFKVELPAGSGIWVNLQQAAREIGRRLLALFEPDGSGARPCHGSDPRFQHDPAWAPYVLFYEYFHGETGRGLGASHQTGWTALVTRVIEDMYR
ncbi:MAG: glucosidase [Pirellulaceae bacterium]|nr:MAG: glucosidase [Pirellulaceae bacterium]